MVIYFWGGSQKLDHLQLKSSSREEENPYKPTCLVNHSNNFDIPETSQHAANIHVLMFILLCKFEVHLSCLNGRVLKSTKAYSNIQMITTMLDMRNLIVFLTYYFINYFVNLKSNLALKSNKGHYCKHNLHGIVCILL